MIFHTLGAEVLDHRDRDGVRGYKREESRWNRHVSVAAFAQTDVKDVTPPMLRDWLRTMTDKKAMGPGEDAIRLVVRETVAAQRGVPVAADTMRELASCEAPDTQRELCA